MPVEVRSSEGLGRTLGWHNAFAMQRGDDGLTQALNLCVVRHTPEPFLERGVRSDEYGPLNRRLAIPITFFSHAGTSDGELRLRRAQVLDEPTPVFTKRIARDDSLLR